MTLLILWELKWLVYSLFKYLFAGHSLSVHASHSDHLSLRHLVYQLIPLVIFLQGFPDVLNSLNKNFFIIDALVSQVFIEHLLHILDSYLSEDDV
jgi:hypothetical protein